MGMEYGDYEAIKSLNIVTRSNVWRFHNFYA